MPMKLHTCPDTLWLCLTACSPHEGRDQIQISAAFFGQFFFINFKAQPISHLHVPQAWPSQAVPRQLPGVSLRADQTTRRGDQRDHTQPLTSHAHHSPQQ